MACRSRWKWRSAGLPRTERRGKSTTMRMITGFIPPRRAKSSSAASTCSTTPFRQTPHRLLARERTFIHRHDGPGFLAFAAELRGLYGEARKRAIDRVVEMCFLESVLHQSIETLSKGFRHRTCFAQSIIHDPPVLVLDEPTDGLDPNQKHEVRTLIRKMGQTKAIVFSTHILEEVDAAFRARSYRPGRIVANGLLRS